MKTAIKIGSGIGMLILLLIGSGGIHPSHPLMITSTYSRGGPVVIPVAPYSYWNENGSLVLDISSRNPHCSGKARGLSSESVYVFEDVLIVVNRPFETESSVICVRISSKNPSVQFFSGSFTGKWSRSMELTVGREKRNVGVRVNSPGEITGARWDSFTIEVMKGACQ